MSPHSSNKQKEARNASWLTENIWKVAIGALLGLTVIFSGFAAGSFLQTSQPSHPNSPAHDSAEPSKQKFKDAVETDEHEIVVYATRTGSKYHRGSCQYLRKSRIPMSLADAKQSYDACSVCNPPR